ncbi:hypothetical protein [Endozoicomonas sp.]|uniref:hypothetical protein n=1 Tax=Endozoicomonas sp. TaxID=1892382 RepID=UPI003AF9E7B5
MSNPIDGDVVCLLGVGKPKMTVKNKVNDTECECEWFDIIKKIQHEKFQNTELDIIEEYPKPSENVDPNNPSGFKIGDSVHLRSDINQTLVVREIDGNDVTCIWFDEKHRFQKHTFLFPQLSDE